MRALSALALVLVLAASAQAQSTPYPSSKEPAESDLTQLPQSIKVWYPAPDGWVGRAAFWATAIWPRDSKVGAWFRADTDYLVMSLWKERVFIRPYRCDLELGKLESFECTDLFGTAKHIQCPGFLNASAEPSEWRSDPSSGDKWFVWSWENGSDQRWKAWTERLGLVVGTASVSDDKQRITCNYPVTWRAGGPYEQADVWVGWR